MAAVTQALNHPYLLGFGALLLVLGFLLCRWASRYDLKGLAAEAAIKVAWNKGDLNTETEIGNRLKELQDEKSNVKRATTVAGHAARHVLSRFVNLAGLASLLVGAGLIAAAFFWK
ncbi:MAG: hypothetical protein ACKVP7_17805 [Hyphomicrobiaceae bacterium]